MTLFISNERYSHLIFNCLVTAVFIAAFGAVYEGSHLRFVEEGRVLSAPQVQEIVFGILLVFRRCVILECSPDNIYHRLSR